jgi:RNA polymerase sigma-70 factor (ECF subfamily)
MQPDSVPAAFPSTLWGMIRAAGSGNDDPAARREALGRLFTRYSKPICWYFRLSCNKSPADALDLTQAFFVHVLESDFASKADPSRGRFRSFLRGSLSNFVKNDLRRDRVESRGGPAPKLSLSLDEGDLESAELLAAGRDLGPDKVFEREWTAAVFRNAVEETRTRLSAAGRATAFEVFKRYDLDGSKERYGDLAVRMKRTEAQIIDDLRVARESFRESVRAEVRETVGSDAEMKAELAELFAWLK